MTPEEMVSAARAAREQAYAPYSRYQVGAAVQTADGRIFTGCNIENASYGLSMCAERTAIFAAVAAGAREITAVTVVTADGGTPCGACRQVLAEFSPASANLPVFLADDSGTVRETTLAALLPDAFRLAPPAPNNGGAGDAARSTNPLPLSRRRRSPRSVGEGAGG